MSRGEVSQQYKINKNVAFGFLNLIDVEKIRDEVTDDWFNQTLCEVNDCVVPTEETSWGRIKQLF